MCKVHLLKIKNIATLCEKYANDKRTIIGSWMDDEFRNFYQNLLRLRNANHEEVNQTKVDMDFEEYCIQKK